MSCSKSSMRGRMIVWAVAMIGGAVAGIWFDLRYFRPLFENIRFHIVSFLAGAVLLRLVLNAARNSGRYLSAHGREGDIPRFDTNKLVTDGLYGCMRHPMHLGLLFWPLSLALLIGSPTFILIIAPLEMVVMLILIKTVEEPGAIKKFGDAYKDYMKRVPMFSFRRECLKKLFGKGD